jgi:hypothetical protein
LPEPIEAALAQLQESLRRHKHEILDRLHQLNQEIGTWGNELDTPPARRTRYTDVVEAAVTQAGEKGITADKIHAAHPELTRDNIHGALQALARKGAVTRYPGRNDRSSRYVHAPTVAEA